MKLAERLSGYNFDSQQLKQLMNYGPVLLEYAIDRLALKESREKVISPFGYLLHICQEESINPSSNFLKMHVQKMQTHKDEKGLGILFVEKQDSISEKEKMESHRRKLLDQQLNSIGRSTSEGIQLQKEHDDMESSIKKTLERIKQHNFLPHQDEYVQAEMEKLKIEVNILTEWLLDPQNKDNPCRPITVFMYEATKDQLLKLKQQSTETKH